MIPKHVFREYDIRGIFDVEIDIAFARRLGIAFAEILRNKEPQKEPPSVVIGYDCRHSGPALLESLVHALREEGVHVTQIGLVPTPLLYFATHQENYTAGIQVTASHNPKEFNGFKLVVERASFFGADIQELHRLMVKVPEARMLAEHPLLGSYQERDFESTYIDWVQRSIGVLPKAKIVLDAGNGAGAVLGPKLLKALGAEIIPLYCDFDGDFPNHHPDPTIEANLEVLKQTVIDTQADFGVGLDGDADRIGVVDETGRFWYGDELLVALARDVLEEYPGATILSEVKCSSKLFDDVKARGGQALMWKAGHSNIKAKMKETGAKLGGEMSGHIFFADRFFGYDDAIYAAARLYALLAKKKPLSSWISDLPDSISTPEMRMDCPDALKFQIVAEVRARLLTRFDSVVILDGVRVETPKGWGLLRASNTQPAMVLRFEAKDEASLKELQQIFVEEIKAAKARLEIPFCDALR